MVSITPSILQCLDNILLQHPEIDLYKIKKEGKSFFDIYQLFNEEQRRLLSFSLLTIFVTKYYPCPDNFQQRLSCLDQSILDYLVKSALGSELKQRLVLEELLTQEELTTTSLGYALRINGYLDSPFTFSHLDIIDYSTKSLAYAMTASAKTSLEKQLAKEMLLKSLQEDLAMKLIFLPLDTLRDDLLFTKPSSTGLYNYNFTCPISGRHISLEIPDCYRFTEQGCAKINLFLASDLAMSYLLWKWLATSTCPNYGILVTSLTYDQSLTLSNLRYFIDLFLHSFHPLLKETIGECLAKKYLSSFNSQEKQVFTDLYHQDKVKTCLLMAESITGYDQMDLSLFKTKLNIYLHSSPQLQEIVVIR